MQEIVFKDRWGSRVVLGAGGAELPCKTTSGVPLVPYIACESHTSRYFFQKGTRLTRHCEFNKGLYGLIQNIQNAQYIRGLQGVYQEFAVPPMEAKHFGCGWMTQIRFRFVTGVVELHLPVNIGRPVTSWPRLSASLVAMFPLNGSTDPELSSWHWVHCLTFPPDTLNRLQFTPKPHKWIRYATGVVVGAQGGLSFSRDPLHDVMEYNHMHVHDLRSESADLYYHTSDAEKQKMF